MADTPFFSANLRDALLGIGAEIDVIVLGGTGPHPWDGLARDGIVLRAVPGEMFGPDRRYPLLDPGCKKPVAPVDPGASVLWSATVPWSVNMTFILEGIIP